MILEYMNAMYDSNYTAYCFGAFLLGYGISFSITFARRLFDMI